MLRPALQRLGKAEERHMENSRFYDSCADIVVSMDVAARHAEPPYAWCVFMYDCVGLHLLYICGQCTARIRIRRTD